MSPGQSVEIAGHSYVFEGVTQKPGPNYTANRGHFRIMKGDKEIAVLEPEKRT